MEHANPVHANQTIIFRDHHASKAIKVIAALRGKRVRVTISKMPWRLIALITRVCRYIAICFLSLSAMHALANNAPTSLLIHAHDMAINFVVRVVPVSVKVMD